jgi:hypothetical protein
MDNLEIKKHFFSTLSERDRRHYAAVESFSIGWGGVKKVSQLFDIHTDTIVIGRKEILTKKIVPSGRVRQSGGGRKKKPKTL